MGCDLQRRRRNLKRGGRLCFRVGGREMRTLEGLFDLYPGLHCGKSLWLVSVVVARGVLGGGHSAIRDPEARRSLVVICPLSFESDGVRQVLLARS